MNIQQLLKTCIQRGLTQQDIANRIGLSQGRISQILRNGGGCTYAVGRALEQLVAETDSSGEVADKELAG